MSELGNVQNNEWFFRRQLLSSVSFLALLATVSSIERARAEDTDRPTVWIELGGQLEQVSKWQEPFTPPFVPNIPNTFYSLIGAQRPPQYSFGGEGAVSFEPNGSDWVFSVSARFGRSSSVKNKHQETPNAHVPVHFSKYGHYFKTKSKYPSSHVKFEDFKATQSQTHIALDFQAGKDVGLGMFGNRGSSVLSAGIRFAQFSSKANISMRAEPDVHYPSQPLSSIPAILAFHYAAVHFHDYAGMETNQRSFRGIGPSLAWNASAQFAGNQNASELTVDWGANAAILFGRQKASGHHQTTVQSFYKKGYVIGDRHEVQGFMTISTIAHSHAAPFDRSRTVIVPNLGGFAGVSWRYPNAKVSVGYRADFFFGAMDGGIDTRKSETLGFYGPFASVSVGIGG